MNWSLFTDSDYPSMPNTDGERNSVDYSLGEDVVNSNTLCRWGEWGQWGACESVSRNGRCSQWGSKKRVRSSATNPAYCDNSALSQEQTTCTLQLGPECGQQNLLFLSHLPQKSCHL